MDQNGDWIENEGEIELEVEGDEREKERSADNHWWIRLEEGVC